MPRPRRTEDPTQGDFFAQFFAGMEDVLAPAPAVNITHAPPQPTEEPEVSPVQVPPVQPNVAAIERLVTFMHAKLSAGLPVTNPQLMEEARTAFATVDPDPRLAYDCAELAMNRWILERFDDPALCSVRLPLDRAEAFVAELEARYDLMPRQTRRTDATDDLQQFSTPPSLAFAAWWAARVLPVDVVMEPSAGNGGLAVFAHAIGAEVHANELSAQRASMLERLGLANVSRENAEVLDKLLPVGVKPRVVMMNPPFSVVQGRPDARSRDFCCAHLEQMLSRLADGGRLVAIVGETFSTRTGGLRDWWQRVAQTHTVRAEVAVDGADYARYGTTFNSNLLIIDKVPNPSGSQPLYLSAKRHAELPRLLQPIRELSSHAIGQSLGLSDPRTALPETPGAGSPADDGRSVRPIDVPAPDGDAAGGTGTTLGSAIDGSGAPGHGIGGGTEPGGTSGVDVGPRADGALGGRRRRRAPALGGDAGGTPRSGGTELFREDVSPALEGGVPLIFSAAPAAADGGEDAYVFETYGHVLDVPGCIRSTVPLEESSAMASVRPNAPAYQPVLPPRIITQGLLALHQLEAVVFAGAAHSKMQRQFYSAKDKEAWIRRWGSEPPPMSRTGFFIGDGTGVGKGREAGGIILDNMLQGRKRAIWLSEKRGLANDARRDLFDLQPGLDRLVVEVGGFPAKAALPSGPAIMFCTYDTLRGGEKASTQKLRKIMDQRNVRYADRLLMGWMKDALGGKPPAGAMGLNLEALAEGRRAPHTVETALQNWKRDDYEVLRSCYVAMFSFALAREEDDCRDFRELHETLVEGVVRDSLHGLLVPVVGMDTQLTPPKVNLRSRVDQLVEWAGPEFDGVLIMDECDAMGNCGSVATEGEKEEASQRAIAGIELQRRLPLSRLVYMSATGATVVRNLGYAERLGLWGDGTAFADKDAFTAQISAGGVAAMEVVARDLKALGLYMARSLSWRGVEYSRLDHHLTADQREVYDTVADAWAIAGRSMAAAMLETGITELDPETGETKVLDRQAKTRRMAQFRGAQLRFFSTLVTAMKMPSLIADIERRLGEGGCAVIQLVNTNEADAERNLARASETEMSLADVEVSPKDILIDFVLHYFPIHQQMVIEDGEGKRRSELMRDAQGEPVVCPEAMQMREELLDRLASMRVPGGSLDQLITHFGPDMVAEVTGRTKRLETRTTDGKEVTALVARSIKNGEAEAIEFNDDKRRILVFSYAGGTGRSYHAALKIRNKRRRGHYLLQGGWSASKAVQGFGRTNRNGCAIVWAEQFAQILVSMAANDGRPTNTVAQRLHLGLEGRLLGTADEPWGWMDARNWEHFALALKEAEERMRDDQDLRSEVIATCGRALASQVLATVAFEVRRGGGAIYQTPDVILVTTDVPGEARFISAVARRIETMGALTRGQRQAGGGGVFRPEDNLEGELAREALIVLFRQVQGGGVEGIGLERFAELTGLSITTKEGDLKQSLPKMSQFLNRVLAMPLDMQSRFMAVLDSALQQVHDLARREGRLDLGVEMLERPVIERMEERVIRHDETTGAVSSLVTLNVGEPLEKTPFRYYSDSRHYFYVKSNVTGRVFAIDREDGGFRTNVRSGAVEEKYRLRSPRVESKSINRVELRNLYTEIPAAEAAEAWTAEYTKLPELRFSTMHLVTGVLLPIWSKIGGNVQVLRVRTTDSGERYLGRHVHPSALGEMLQALGVSGVKLYQDIKDLIKQLEDGLTAGLDRGWSINAVSVSGAERLRIMGPNYADHGFLEELGVKRERVGYSMHYYIPVGPDTERILGALIDARPVMSLKVVESETAAREGHARSKAQPPVGAGISAQPGIAGIAAKHRLDTARLRGFVDGILERLSFDAEQLSELLAPLGLGWKERARAEVALMADLHPLLSERAQGREISGLRAYLSEGMGSSPQL